MASEESANYVLLNQLADEFAARYRAGERPNLQEYIDRHPELAGHIRELFPAMVEMEQVKEDHQEAAEQAAAPATPALQQLGDFRIIREVGKGGMGIVYEAEQVSLGRHVALKVLPKSMLVDAKAKRRFEREAKSAAKLHHTNIVPVFGVGEQDGMQYYVMQFIQGLGLDEVLEELRKLQIGNVKTGDFIGAELRVSRTVGHVSNVPSPRHVENVPHGELSAANVAMSLLTGKFERTIDQPNGAEELSAPARVVPQEDQGPDASRSPALSDSFTLTSSSVVLPGRSREGSKSKGRKQTYWRSVASIGVQVADALEYAHKQGVHHRDIKPSNLLLDTQGTVWVTDFGLAKADDQQNLTHTGDILGTLRYMPPEAFEGKTDARSDVYSLGLTLYEMLAFRPAFDERERNRLIKQVMHEEPVRLDKLNRQVPQDLETIVHKAIDKDPKQRYASAGALAEDLQRFIEDEPIKARRVSQTERLWRWGRRNPVVAGLTAGIAALLILVAAASTVAALRFSALAEQERSARLEADEARLKAEAAQQREAEQLHQAEAARAVAEAAEKSEAEQRRQSDANLAKARAAVDYFTGVAENDLLKIPGALSLRRQVLQAAKTYYEDFLKDRGDDPALRAELAATFLRIGRIGSDLGQNAEVRETLKKAIAGYEAAAAAAPKNAELQDRLADSWEALGDVDLREGRFGAAYDPWRKATQIRQALVQTHPKNAGYREKLATMYNRLGIAQGMGGMGLPAKAFESYRECTEIRLELVRGNPNSPTLQYGLGESFLNLGFLLNNTGQHREALALWLRSQDFYRAACAKMPYMVEFALDLGTAYEWVGNLYWDLGQREQAVQQFQQGLDHILARVRSYPDVPTYQRQLVENSRKLSTRLREVGRKEEARTTLLHACQALASLPEPTGENLYLLAGLQAQSAALIGHGKTELTPDEHAQERRELDAARATLRRAIAAGFKDFGRVKNDLKLMRNDPSSKAMLERYGVSFASFERSILSDAAAKDFKAAVAKGEGQGAKEAQDKQSGDPARNPKLLKADLARSRLAIGLLNSEFGKHRESAQALAEALSIRQELARSDPKNVQYQEDLASAYIAQGHVDWRAGRAADANRKWQKGLDLLHQAFHDPSQEQQLTAHLVSFELALGNRYAEVGLWSEAADHYAQAFAKQPPGNPLDWAFFAPVLLLNGDVSEYRRLCTNMLHQFGDTPGIQWVFEIIYGASLGSTEASEVARWVQLAEGELAVQPHLDWRMSKLAQALYRAGRFKDSLQAFQQSPNLIEGWPVRAMVHHRLGQTESARQWLAKADDSSKKTIQYALARDSLLLPWYPWWRNWAGFQIVRHEAKELIEGSPVPDDPWLRLLRGRAYAKLGLPEKADSDFQAAVAVNPKDPEIWRARSKVFAQLGQTDRAKADFAKAMELKP